MTGRSVACEAPGTANPTGNCVQCWRASENAVFWSSAEQDSRLSSSAVASDPLIQLDPLAGLTTNPAPSEIAVAFTSRPDNQTITLIRHARSALASSIGALT
jgi:hypothetical protein